MRLTMWNLWNLLILPFLSPDYYCTGAVPPPFQKESPIYLTDPGTTGGKDDSKAKKNGPLLLALLAISSRPYHRV